MEKMKVTILTTGGTIEKIYNEDDGSLKNRDVSYSLKTRQSQLKNKILTKLRLPHTDISVFEIMSKDSLDMDDKDRQLIWQTIEQKFAEGTPILVLHGTDTMEISLRYCYEQCPTPPVAVIFTGAMMPIGFEDSDALQNFCEALALCQVVPAGFYISFHNHLFKAPHVTKNKKRRTFEEQTSC
ncbi:MAG: asparaginase [Bdellovibrionaceae bacterium]|nr:asparaginase [Pseudobdellovibrionaceae bacterium]